MNEEDYSTSDDGDARAQFLWRNAQHKGQKLWAMPAVSSVSTRMLQ